MHYHLVDRVWVGIVPYQAIMFVKIAIHPKMRHFAKDDFLAQIVVLLQTLRSPVSEQTCVGPSPDAKFTKLKSAKGRNLVHGVAFAASSSPAHFHEPRRYGCWLIVYRTGWLEFGHQTLKSRL